MGSSGYSTSKKHTEEQSLDKRLNERDVNIRCKHDIQINKRYNNR